jgi:pilus assembly protein Flp/PilA
MEHFNGKEVAVHMIRALIALIRSDDEGQGLAEYALILALIAIVAILALVFLGTAISDILHQVGVMV